jgi:hypothetical protein
MPKLLGIVVICLLLTSCAGHWSDEQMMSYYEANKETFAKIPSATQEEKAQLLQQLGLKEEDFYDSGNLYWFTTTCSRIAMINALQVTYEGCEYKGFAYQDPQTTNQSWENTTYYWKSTDDPLDTVVKNSDNFAVFRPIDGWWHLYTEYSKTGF